MVLERSTGAHDKVCGDFLSGEAAATLTQLGIGLEELGAARIDRVRLVRGERMVAARLPFRAFGLSRRCLDEALLKRATQCGASVLRGRVVRELCCQQDGFLAIAGTEAWHSRTVFLATGKHDLPGFGRPRKRRMVGWKTYLRLASDQDAALAGAVEIVLIPGGYAGLQPVGGGLAVLCALISDARALRRGGLEPVINNTPHLRSRLQGAKTVLDRPLAISGMPYGFIAGLDRSTGLVRLGDQAGVIPSFAGAGVAIALGSGQAAARSYLEKGEISAAQQGIAEALRGPVGRARILHQALLHPLLQLPAFQFCRVWPGAMRLSARTTRVAFAA